jgi:hypothetical protein
MYSRIQTNGMADVTILGRKQAAESAFTISVPQCMAGFGHVFPLSFTHFLTNKQNGNQLYQMIVTSKKNMRVLLIIQKKKKDITSSRRSQGDEDPKGLLIG